MRRLALIAFLGFAAIVLTGAGQPAPQRMIEFTDAQRADLDRVSAYLNSIRTLKGGFTQIGPNGEIDTGEFYLSKPGRMRFEYQPPSPTLIVSDGRTVAVRNKQLNTVDRYALSDTPLDLILGDKIDLRHNPAIVGIERQDGALIVQARSNNNRTKGNISLVFAAPELELRQWTVTDSQNLTTTVALRDTAQGVTLPASLFALADNAAPAKKR